MPTNKKKIYLVMVLLENQMVYTGILMETIGISVMVSIGLL